MLDFLLCIPLLEVDEVEFERMFARLDFADGFRSFDFAEGLRFFAVLDFAAGLRFFALLDLADCVKSVSRVPSESVAMSK